MWKFKEGMNPEILIKYGCKKFFKCNSDTGETWISAYKFNVRIENIIIYDVTIYNCETKELFPNFIHFLNYVEEKILEGKSRAENSLSKLLYDLIKNDVIEWKEVKKDVR